MHFHNLVFAFVMYVTTLLIAQDCRCITLNDRIITEYLIGEDVEGTDRGIICDIIPNFPGFIEENRENLNHYSRFMPQNFYLEKNPEHKERILLIRTPLFINIVYPSPSQYTLLSYCLSIG